MAAAPGQTAQNDVHCYNCGSNSHWMVACPEPTRNKPAGLERWKSQHQEQPLERNGNHEKKGPIVTRYPPPPGQVPGAQRYPPQFQPGAPPLPPQGYPQPGFTPPPPAYGGYPPPLPPQYGQYAPAPVPAPQPFAQYSGYGQPHYGGGFPPHPPNYFPGGAPPPPPPSTFPGGAPPPPPSTFHGAYPDQHYGVPPHPPPVVAGPFPPFPVGVPPPPPPPPSQQYSPGPVPAFIPPPPPAVGAYAAPVHHPAPSFERPAGLPARPPPPISQSPSGHNRNRNQRHPGSKRNNSHRDRNHRPGHDGSGRTGSNRNERPIERQAVQESKQAAKQSARQTPKHPSRQLPKQSPKEKGPKTPVSDMKSDNDASYDFDPESEQDLERVFPPIETKEADPVGIPLPADYTEEPTIPPAYNATCIKSDFFDENAEEFCRPIRATAQWSEARWDPLFKNDYPGMIKRRFEGHDHDYASYEPPAPLSPSDPIKIPPRYKIDRAALQVVTPDSLAREGIDSSARGGYSHQDSLERTFRDSPSSRYDKSDRRFAKRSRDHSLEDLERGSRDLKRSRGSDPWRSTPRKNGSRPLSPVHGSSSSPRFNIEKDPWSPQAGESNVRRSNDNRFLDVHPDNKSSSSREGRIPLANARHDSGYHSGQSLDRTRSALRDNDRGRRESGRSAPNRRSPSRSPSRNRASSPDRSRSRSESPLTSWEAQLLGLVDEPQVDRPAERRVTVKPKKKAPVKRKVAAAYDRRW